MAYIERAWRVTDDSHMPQYQTLIECNLFEQDGKYAIFVEYSFLREDGRSKPLAIDYDSGYRFKSLDNAKRKADRLKAIYEKN